MGIMLRNKVKARMLTIYTMELLIVILGISIAFRFQVYNEGVIEERHEQSAIQKLYLENELNLAKFESLQAYRFNMEQNTRILLAILDSPFKANKDSLSNYIFDLQRISTPDFQEQSMDFYLSSSLNESESELDEELIALRNLYNELGELTEHYWDKKTKYFFDYLKDEVDFANREIISTSKLSSLEFRNDIWSLFLDEIEQNRLYKDSFDRLILVQDLTEAALNSKK
jgi:hypothetical protein